MSNVSTQVISSMFNHLAQSYSEDEAKKLLIQKYPDSAEVISQIDPAEYRRTMVEMGSAVKVVEPADSAPQPKAAKPSKAKTVKPAKEAAPVKAAKAPKEAKPVVVTSKKETKVDVARRLFNEATDKSRGAMIQVFVDQLGMSKAAASTYFYNIKASQ